MSESSSIEWTDATWNPVRGCTKVSPGCVHCYAETFAERFRGVLGHPYEHGFNLRLVPEKLLEPLEWARPKMIFVNSMSDLFHEAIPTDYVAAVGALMAESPWHIYQVLTKRATRLRDLLGKELATAAMKPNIWWGVSVEDRKHGLPRIDLLRQAPAAVRFLSVEPLLEDLGEINLEGIHWVIVGGESGAGARVMRPEWVNSVHEQCKRGNVAFFFKQWGGIWKSRTGRLLNDRTYDEFPAIVRAPVPERGARDQLAARLRKHFSINGIVQLIHPSATHA